MWSEQEVSPTQGAGEDQGWGRKNVLSETDSESQSNRRVTNKVGGIYSALGRYMGDGETFCYWSAYLTLQDYARSLKE